MVKCGACDGTGKQSLVIDNERREVDCWTCRGECETPGLVGKTLCITIDGLSWELGTIVEEYNGAWGGGWAFRVANENNRRGAVFADIRKDDKFFVADPATDEQPECGSALCDVVHSAMGCAGCPSLHQVAA